MNDIALVKLAEEVNIKDEPDANVICLPQEKTGSNTYDKASCTASGWGRTGNIYYSIGSPNNLFSVSFLDFIGRLR